MPDLDDHKNELRNDQIKSGRSVNNPERMFLSGSLKFYEDILLSLRKALIVVYNNSGHHIEVWQSPEFATLYGLPDKAFKNKSLSEIFIPKIASEILKNINRVFETAMPTRFNLLIRFPKGTFLFEILLSPLLDNHGLTSAVTGYFQDITTTNENSGKENITDEIFRSLVESDPNAIITTNLEKQISYVNPKFIEFAGGETKDYVGQDFAELPIFLSGHKLNFDLLFTSVINSGQPKTFDFNCSADILQDKFNYCEALISPVLNLSEQIGFQIKIRNITIQREAEKELLFSSQFYKRIVENMQEAVFVISNGQVNYCNSESLRLINTDSSNVLNKPFKNIIYHEDTAKVDQYLNDVNSDIESDKSFQFRMIEKNKEIVWVQGSSSIIDWADEQAILLTIVDISGAKLKEDKEHDKIRNLQLLIEKAIDFINYTPQSDFYDILGQEIVDYIGNALLIFVSYNAGYSGVTIEHFAASQQYLNTIDTLNHDKYKLLWENINPDYIRDLSIDKLIRFKDGHYESDSRAFPSEILTLVEEQTDLGEIYLIGLSWDNTVHGSIFILLPKDEKIHSKKTLESIVKFGSTTLRRKERIEIISRKEEKYKRIFEAQQDIYFKIDLVGIVIEVSPNIEKATGYQPDEFIGNPVFDFINTKANDRRLSVKLLKNGSIKDHDIQLVKKDGSLMDISLNAITVTDQLGKPIGYEGFLRDITTRKKSEKQLFDSEERFKTLFFKSPDPLFVEDYEGNVLDVNPAACILHDLAKEDLIGMNVVDLVPPDYRSKVKSDFQYWISGKTISQRSFSLTSKGDIIPVEIHASKVIYDGKNALLFISRDITKLTETENILKEAKEKAEQADKLKSVFLANMSHEIRTPMNAIVGFSEILSDQKLSHKEREEFIKYISQGSDTLMNLIEDIIDITKIEAGQISVNYTKCSVTELMDELYAIFLKVKDKGDKKHIDLRLSKPVVDASLSISTDKARVRQILSNLLGNSMKFTENGMIEFGFKIKNKNTIQFFVKDTGIGIPSDKLDSVFERFVQIDNKSKHKGTGLGLAISRRLAELLGGSLNVESEYGVGSEFKLELPLSEEYISESQNEKKHYRANTDWSSKKFLIAEDSALNYSYLEALFLKTKVELLWAKDGREAVELCRKHQDIDLVLMDIKMPVLDGLDAISEIRKFRKNLPIIVQTAYAMVEDREKSIAAGGDEHLTKPLNADELFNTINRFLN